jgi:hypothetical protein
LPEQNVVHHVIADAQSDVQQQQALQQVIDRIRKLNIAAAGAAAGAGAKKSRHRIRPSVTAAVEVSHMRHNFVSIIIAIFK